MTQLRWMTAGESHGPRVTAIIDGVVAGLPLVADDIDRDLVRRQRGYGRGGRMKIEHDRVTFTGGVRDGRTLGSPVCMTIENRDFASWTDRMSPEPLAARPDALTRPRPGHADLAGGLKFDRDDLRDVLERASARETAARTAAGAVARRLLAELGIEVFAHVVSIGGVQAAVEGLAVSELRERSRQSDLACADEDAAAKMRAAILATAHAGDTLGGVFEVVVLGAPPGLGSHTHWDRKLDGRLAQALMSIQAIKGVEIGEGWAGASRRGSAVHDPIHYDRSNRRFTRSSTTPGAWRAACRMGSPSCAAPR